MAGYLMVGTRMTVKVHPPGLGMTGCLMVGTRMTDKE